MQYTIKIEHDEIDIESPFEYEEDMIFLSNHRDYSDQNANNDKLDHYDGLKELAEHYSNYNLYNVNAYIHSGIALSLGNSYPFDCQWDSGFFGVLLVEKAAGIPEKSVESFIENYGQYLNGEVYYYSITDDQGEIVDSCGGFIGYDHVEIEANDSLKYIMRRNKKDRENKLKSLIKNKVSLELRDSLLKAV